VQGVACSEPKAHQPPAENPAVPTGKRVNQLWFTLFVFERQAWLGVSSRTHFVVRSISRGQGCPP